MLLGLGLLVPALASAQPNSLSFTRLGVAQGLASTRINGIAQDRTGYLWIATPNGLDRFDGHSFRLFPHDPSRPESLAASYVRCVFRDSAGRIWAGTRNGLGRFQDDTETFANFLPGVYVQHIAEGRAGALWLGTDRGLVRWDPGAARPLADPRSSSLGATSVLHVREDSAGRLWVATDGQGLYRFDAGEGPPRHYLRGAGGGLGSDTVLCVFEGTKRQIRVGTVAGLDLYDPDRDDFGADPVASAAVGGQPVFSILEDDERTLWVGSYAGLVRLDPHRHTATRSVSDPADARSLSNDQVRALHTSADGLLWVGTMGAGLSVHDPRTRLFDRIRPGPGQRDTLCDPNVSAIAEDRSGRLWIGTIQGLSVLDPATARLSCLRPRPLDPDPLPGGSVLGLLVDRQGELWVATYGGGLAHRLATGRFETFRHREGQPDSLSSNDVSALYQDGRGRLWVGTRRGLDLYHPETRSFETFRHRPDDRSSLVGDNIRCLLEDRKGRLWIGTQSGLALRDPGTGAFESFRHDPARPGTLSGDIVTFVHEDRRGTLWVGTDGAGLNRWDEVTRTFHAIRKGEGLSDDAIWGALEDAEGRLWLSSNRGLDRLAPESLQVRSFDADDGLQGDEFNAGAFHAGRDGRFYFGGKDGLTAFDPEQVEEDRFRPPVVVTDLYLFNRRVPAAGGPLRIEGGRVAEVVLGPDDDLFGFEFAGLSPRRAEKRRYRYRLDGFDRDWVEADASHRRATYTKVPHGAYVFRAGAAAGDGSWSDEGAAVRVVIHPPWWLTWWAKTLDVLLALAAGSSLYLWRVRRLTRRQRELEQRQAELETQVAQRTALIAEQKREIEAHAEHMTASIRYAERIQQAMLPVRGQLERALPGSVVLYQPRDIVSGDFYWLAETPSAILVAVVDCTGHGVPGAFLSMLGASVLDDLVTSQGLTEPAEVLAQLHLRVMQSLKQGQAEGNQDGMDAALVRLDRSAGRLQVDFAGARRPLYVARAGQVTRIDGDRKTIGGERGGARAFTPHRVKVASGDRIYLASDGLVDQLDPAGKRLGTRRFQELLERIAPLPAADQLAALEQALAGHRQGEPQLDDVTVVGLRIP